MFMIQKNALNQITYFYDFQKKWIVLFKKHFTEAMTNIMSVHDKSNIYWNAVSACKS